MNINIKHEEVKKIAFSNIPVGDIFIQGSTVWMKLPTLTEEDDDTFECNAIALEDGETDYFDFNAVVIIPKVVELNIEY